MLRCCKTHDECYSDMMGTEDWGTGFTLLSNQFHVYKLKYCYTQHKDGSFTCG